MTVSTHLDDVAAFEQIVHFADSATQLDGYIAIHSTRLGPALGGVRFHPYARPGAALEDAMRLARGMTYKAAAAGLDLGGGKAVINGDPRELRSERLFRAFGRVVDSLGGRYITAEDVGTTVEDMAAVAEETAFVTGRAVSDGGLGDPSPSTALGVLVAMKAALAYLDGDDSLEGRTVAVAGLGKVGAALVELVVDAGARAIVADVDAGRVAAVAKATGATASSVDAIHQEQCDVYSPCALGGVLDPVRIGELRCRAVVGAANNQLADDAHAELLSGRDVLYVPDFVANAGGLIHVASEGKATAEEVHETVMALGPRVASILALAAEHGISTLQAAEQLAEARLADGRLSAAAPFQDVG